MTGHPRRGRKRRTLTRRERSTIARLLRMGPTIGGFDLTLYEFNSLATEIIESTIIVESKAASPVKS